MPNLFDADLQGAFRALDERKEAGGPGRLLAYTLDDTGPEIVRKYPWLYEKLRQVKAPWLPEQGLGATANGILAPGGDTRVNIWRAPKEPLMTALRMLAGIAARRALRDLRSPRAKLSPPGGVTARTIREATLVQLEWVHQTVLRNATDAALARCRRNLVRYADERYEGLLDVLMREAFQAGATDRAILEALCAPAFEGAPNRTDPTWRRYGDVAEAGAEAYEAILAEHPDLREHAGKTIWIDPDHHTFVVAPGAEGQAQLLRKSPAATRVYSSRIGAPPPRVRW